MDKVLSLLTFGKRPEWDTSQSRGFSCPYFSVTYLYNWVKRDSGAIKFLVQVKEVFFFGYVPSCLFSETTVCLFTFDRIRRQLDFSVVEGTL